MHSRRRFFRFVAVGTVIPSARPALAGTWTRLGGSVATAYGVRVNTGAGGRVGPAGIARGTFHSLFVRSDGWLMVGGWLAPGDPFTEVFGIDNSKSVASGLMSSFYVDSRGRVFGTGDGSFGQLGNGFTPSQSGGFVQGTGVSNAIEVATSGRFALVRSVNGYVYGTGYNFSGMLGVNGTQNRSTFVRATGVSNVIAVACGDFHSLALRADGAVFSSGASSYGQNARGIAGDTSTFAQAIGISACVAIVATSNTS